MPDDSVTIVVHRPRGARDLLRAYTLVLDGEEVGRIRQGGRLEVSTTPGRHTIRATIDWSGSPEVAFTTAAGSVVDVEVRARSVLTGFVDILSRAGWVDIEVTGGGVAEPSGRGSDDEVERS
ncbi:hypothetical protein [Kineococcus sp. NPDC059986]|jgi:hypothetical protein|uniref:hypothetical protein n=1 Tax=Kineococcus sp. NPDC059986 TaxID=3155538 RepID=UPI00344FEC09